MFGIYDLQISRAVVDRQCGWAHWIELYGEIPGAVIMIVAICVAFSQRRRRADKIKEWLLSIVTIAGCAFLLYLLLGWQLYHYFPDFVKIHSRTISLAMPVAVAAILTAQRVLSKKPVAYSVACVHACFFTIWLGFINVVLFVQGFKNFWGRVRFRDLQPDYANFTPWYLPGAGGGESFPSGHTALAWMLLPLILLAAQYGKKTKTTVAILVFCWGILMAAARVVIGAHYASDTLFPSCMAFACFLLYVRVYSPEISRQ